MSKRPDPVAWFERLFLKGRSLDEVMLEAAVGRWRMSWSEQPRDERKRRMRFVLLMAAELAEIRKHTNFSTGFCEMCIEAVIMGDVDDLVGSMEMFAFEREHPDTAARYVPVFARFKDICNDAVITFRSSPQELKS